MADKKVMSFQERQKMERVEALAEKIRLHGLCQLLIIGALNAVFSFLGSLNEKYNLVERLGLNRIW